MPYAAKAATGLMDSIRPVCEVVRFHPAAPDSCMASVAILLRATSGPVGGEVIPAKSPGMETTMDDLCSDASKVIPPLHWFQRGNSRCYDLHSATSQAAGVVHHLATPGRPAACRETHVKAGLSHAGIAQLAERRICNPQAGSPILPAGSMRRLGRACPTNGSDCLHIAP